MCQRFWIYLTIQTQMIAVKIDICNTVFISKNPSVLHEKKKNSVLFQTCAQHEMHMLIAFPSVVSQDINTSSNMRRVIFFFNHSNILILRWYFFSSSVSWFKKYIFNYITWIKLSDQFFILYFIVLTAYLNVLHSVWCMTVYGY